MLRLLRRKSPGRFRAKDGGRSIVSRMSESGSSIGISRSYDILCGFSLKKSRISHTLVVHS
jgi:hypothetical protein